MMELDPELLEEFTVESTEHLEAVEPLLLAMEQGSPADADEYNRIFRALHSIKGAAGFLGLDQIQGLSHVSESLLMRLRDGEMPFDVEMADPLLRVVDTLRQMLRALPNPSEYPPELYAEIESLLNAGLGAESASAAPNTVPAAGSAVARTGTSLLIGEICVEMGYLTPDQSKSVLAAQKASEPRRSFGSLAQGLGLMTEAQISEALAEQMIRLARVASAPPATPPTTEDPPDAKPAAVRIAPATTLNKRSGARNETIRVSVPLLNKLMDLAGELVLSRNQLRQRLEHETLPGIKNLLGRMDLITSELQESIMNTRMQPMRGLFDRLPRMVRDISQKLGKEVDLELEGGDVELDRSILETLSDPMTHLIRNALDHGMETPSERVARGKRGTGTLHVRAYHESGQVIVEIVDDGRGIDGARVKAKAVERGVIPQEVADAMTALESIRLVFQAGLSTVEEVTDVSGRGVGMDVVRTNIQQLGGLVELESVVGEGTVVRIRLPLTLAIIPSLIVSTAGCRFAIPQVNLVEVVRIHVEEMDRRLQTVRGVEMLRIREQLLPLVWLDRTLGLENESRAGEEHLNIIVLRADGGSYGLVVDELLDSEEIVVKPLSAFVKSCEWFAGATILGDGAVSMILDVHGLVKRAGLQLRRIPDVHESTGVEADSSARSLIVFTVASRERFALPLGDLQRLERVAIDQIEQVGMQEYIQHRGRAIPLIRLEQLLPVGALDVAQDELFVLIPRLSGGSAGILASRIVDTLVSDLEPDEEDADTPGLLGKAILDGHLTLFLETAGLLRSAGIEPAV